MTQTPLVNRPAPVAAVPFGTAGAPQEFLAFKLDSQEYGINILQVREIRSFDPPVRIANAPPHLLGMYNLRGVIVPVVDLRLHFGVANPVYDEFTVVIVLVLGSRIFGVVVDAVSDVIVLPPEQQRAMPAFNQSVPNDHLLAIGTQGDRTLTLLDIDKLLASPAMGLVGSAELH